MRICPFYHSSAVLFLIIGLPSVCIHAALPYRIADTGQTNCYDNRGAILPPKMGQPFYGQDAQFLSQMPNYSTSTDDLTVHDNITDLTWQNCPDTDADGVLTHRDKLTMAQAREFPTKLNARKYGGFDDWRLPTIKELYSLFDARGTDPSGPMDMSTSQLNPFINTNYFKFAYGDPQSGERIIDAQYATCTLYAGRSVGNFGKLFGVNFADGRIKGYDLQMPGGGGKTFFVLCVRGKPNYGKNDFCDNKDGSITDRATGLTWAKADSGEGMHWQNALAFAQKKNDEKYLGHDDWRLPNIKELHSIVDYTRAPDSTQSPAIDPVFQCTPITNEIGAVDYPFYWSSTTHSGLRGGAAAMYIAFGRAAGWLAPRNAGASPSGKRGPDAGNRSESGKSFVKDRQKEQNGQRRYVDVHGAGSQRSDPKSGDAALFPYGRGPQGDTIRINNFVRLVRGGLTSKTE